MTNDFNAFRRAGWLIMPAQSGGRAGGAAATRRRSSAIATQNRLMIGTKRMAVKFQSDAPPRQAAGKLATAGVTVLRTAGLLEESVSRSKCGAGQDAIDVATAAAEGSGGRVRRARADRAPAVAVPARPIRSTRGSGSGTTTAASAASQGRRRAPRLAWDIGRGSGIRVAVIDNGFDVEHPDLAAALDDATGILRAQAERRCRAQARRSPGSPTRITARSAPAWSAPAPATRKAAAAPRPKSTLAAHRLPDRSGRHRR